MIDPGFRRLLVIAATLAILHGGLARSAPEDAEAFEKEIRPILVENCAKCHGAEKQKAGLRVDSRAALVEGGESGPSIVPGQPDKSLLIEAVRRTGEVRMPPNRGLRDEQVAALERWVAAGAPWPADAPVASKTSSVRATRASTTSRSPCSTRPTTWPTSASSPA